jgi:transcription elongation factor Elf1
MDNGKADDVPYLATCPFCGTQTRVALRASEEDEPVKCRMCGAPLEIELPDPRTKRVRKKPKPVECSQCGALTDVSNVYHVDGMLYCERCNELSHKEQDKWEQRVLLAAIIIGFIITAFIVVVLVTWPY